MRISSNEEFKVFKLLMDEVARECRVDKEFKDFNTTDCTQISKELAQLRKVDIKISPVRPNTLYGYLSMYLQKENHPFRVESEKLNELCDYIGESSWEEFTLKNRVRAGQKYLDYFYKSKDIYASLEKYKNGFDLIISDSTEKMLRSPNEPQHVFNLAICMLYRGRFKEAGNLLIIGTKLEPNNPDFNFFLGLTILEGKRPYQQRKVEIDQILTLLKKVDYSDADRLDCWYLKKLIYNDFHKRIGYTYPNLTLTKENPPSELLKFFEICCGTTNDTIQLLIA